MIPRASLCLLAILAAPAAHAEPVYVIEQLVVGLTSAPGAQGERIGQVRSADRLELIERQGEEAHVRLPDGRDGWIKSSYLSAEPPLQLRLDERTAEVEKLRQDAQRLRQQVGHLESELAAARVAHNVATATAPASAAPSANGSPAAGVNSAVQTVPPAVSDALSGAATPIRETVFLRSPEHPGQTPWPWVLGTAFVMLLVGFALGWKSLDRRIRHKYGGLRIY